VPDPTRRLILSRNASTVAALRDHTLQVVNRSVACLFRGTPCGEVRIDGMPCRDLPLDLLELILEQVNGGNRPKA